MSQPTPLPLHPTSRHLSGIVLFVASTALFSVMNVLIRSLAGEIPAPEIVFLRNGLSLVILLPLAMYHGRTAFRSTRVVRHFWRAFVGLIGMELWFYSLTLMPLNEATALSYISPIFATLFAVLLLGERVGIWRILAIFCGFCGMLLILRPNAETGLAPGAPVVLFAAAMWAIAGIVVKTLTTTDPPWRIVTYMGLFMTVLSAPLGLSDWQTPHADQLWRIAGIALFSTISQLCMVTAFARAPMVMLTPFDFMRLVFTSLLAYLVFGERLDGWTATGAAMIVGSSAFITWREARRRHERSCEARSECQTS